MEVKEKEQELNYYAKKDSSIENVFKFEIKRAFSSIFNITRNMNITKYR